MKTLALLLALTCAAPLFAQQYRGGFGRTGSLSAMTRQYHRPAYYPVQRQLQPFPLYGYSYGPSYYSSAFHPSPIFQQSFNDPYWGY